MNESFQERVDGLFSEWDRSDSPGCALGIYREGEMVYGRGYGAANLEHHIPIDCDTIFHVASLSKQFTVFAAALEQASGRLSLDQDIREFIPELQPGPRISIRQILHHTSGLRDQWDMLRLAGWRKPDLKTNEDIFALATRQRELNFAPGTRFQYINTGYTLLGIAIERISGISFREYTRRHIFEPLGMKHTWFNDDHCEIVRKRAQAYSTEDTGLKISVPDYETVGPTGLLSTVSDFVAWERNLLFPKVGTREMIEEMMTPAPLTDGRMTDYGLGFIVGKYRGLTTAEHSGGDAGFRSHFLRFPDERFAVAIFCNLAEMKPGGLVRRVADICLEGRFPKDGLPDSSVAKESNHDGFVPEVAPHVLEAKSGLYREVSSGIIDRIEHRTGRLFLISASGGEYELTCIGPDRFRFVGAEAECQFEQAEEGRPDRAVISQRDQQTAVLERISGEEPAPQWNPSDYVGTYESDELDVRYEIHASGGALILKRPKFKPSQLRYFSKDQFSAIDEALHLRFRRNSEGRVIDLLLSAERVWNVQMTRR